LTDTSLLLLPRRELASCIFAAIVRDTRGVALGEAERLNHFPASPLVAASYFVDGESRLVPEGGGFKRARTAHAIPRVSVAGPQSKPLTSWNPGPVFAVSIGFYPDAWSLLTGVPASSIADQTSPDVPAPVDRALLAFGKRAGVPDRWEAFQDHLEPFWSSAGRERTGSGWSGGRLLSDWSAALVTRAVISGPGRSLRAAQRRLKGWTGHSRQMLALYASIENLHHLTKQWETASLAGLATEAGFSDQSHMGRAVRRTTGFSPARLNRSIATEEAFWCYRLLGERF
jgi:AraC-like DNA-binding protein